MGQIMADRDGQPARESTGASTSSGSASAVPQLSGAQFDRMTAYGVAQPVQVGDVVFGPGDVDYDLILVESGWIEIVSPATGEEPVSVVARYGPGGFLGELNFLTGQTAYLLARVTEAGRIHRITRAQFRRLMGTEPDLSDILLRTFLARRDLLRDGPAARAIAILGSELSADSLALRTFAARQRLAHLWVDADSAAGRALAESTQITAADLPAVITGHQVLRRATTGQMAQALGLACRRHLPHRELPRFPLRAQRPGADPTRGPTGDEIRRPALEPVSGGRPGHRRSPPDRDAQRRHHDRVPRRADRHRSALQHAAAGALDRLRGSGNLLRCNRTGSSRVPHRTGDRGGRGELRRTGRPVLGVAGLPSDFGGAWFRGGRHHVVVSVGTAAR